MNNFLISCIIISSHLGQPIQPQNLDNQIRSKQRGRGVGEFRNFVSQTFHRKPIKFCCELGFIWCKGRLWWTGKVKVQLCLSWKKDESATAPIRKKLKVHEQIVQGSCHLHVFLPLCTWRGKERQSLHFTWQSSIPASALIAKPTHQQCFYCSLLIETLTPGLCESQP